MKNAAVMAKAPQSRANELEERLVDFAVRVVKLSASLPKTPAGRHMAGQILRSGTSPAPNYGEARSVESAADFIHKLRIVLRVERNGDLAAPYRPQPALEKRAAR